MPEKKTPPKHASRAHAERRGRERQPQTGGPFSQTTQRVLSDADSVGAGPSQGSADWGTWDLRVWARITRILMATWPPPGTEIENPEGRSPLFRQNPCRWRIGVGEPSRRAGADDPVTSHRRADAGLLRPGLGRGWRRRTHLDPGERSPYRHVPGVDPDRSRNAGHRDPGADPRPPLPSSAVKFLMASRFCPNRGSEFHAET